MTVSSTERPGSGSSGDEITVPRVAAGPIRVGDTTVPAGRSMRLEIPVARLPTDTWLSLPVAVVNGRRPGPRVWLTAAVHGDELNGVEIIRQVLRSIDARSLAGAVLAVPIVNVFGFINESRYLPDRRDLNRSFPGSPRGPLASRIAHLVMTEIVAQCHYGIDLHTGSDHRFNLPQVRADLDDDENRRIAVAFGAPVTIHASTRDGSLREAATARGAKVLVYEGGEANRFDGAAIDTGIAGVLRVLASLGMCKPDPNGREPRTLEILSTRWVRARRGGILRLDVGVGDHVHPGMALGLIGDAFGISRVAVKSPIEGVVIGHTRHPLAAQGDAVVHVAETDIGHAALRKRRIDWAPFARQR